MRAERLQQELNSISDNVKTTLLLTLLQPPRFNLISRSNLIIDIDSHRLFFQRAEIAASPFCRALHFLSSAPLLIGLTGRVRPTQPAVGWPHVGLEQLHR